LSFKVFITNTLLGALSYFPIPSRLLHLYKHFHDPLVISTYSKYIILSFDWSRGRSRLKEINSSREKAILPMNVWPLISQVKV
ncbi:hypothetical protein, partial [Candidatus Hakubella thermalkaliphila]|uniref:hypothetical protein n=1 Tax=Candidatus Hakubella thermalkaliphila TaxID=2754717 RepID=UPI001C615522